MHLAQTADSPKHRSIGLGYKSAVLYFPQQRYLSCSSPPSAVVVRSLQFGQHFRCELEFSYAQANDSLLLVLDNNQRIRNYRVSTFARGGVGVYYTSV